MSFIRLKINAQGSWLNAGYFYYYEIDRVRAACQILAECSSHGVKFKLVEGGDKEIGFLARNEAGEVVWK